MKFKYGDEVVNILTSGIGTIGLHMRSASSEYYLVTYYDNGTQSWEREDTLELYNKRNYPHNYSHLYDLAIKYVGEDYENGPNASDTPECDCGGFKTYHNMSPEFHSTWCASQIKYT